MASKKKAHIANATHRATRNVKLDKTWYEPGDEMTLTDEQATELSGHVEVFTEVPAPQEGE